MDEIRPPVGESASEVPPPAEEARQPARVSEPPGLGRAGRTREKDLHADPGVALDGRRLRLNAEHLDPDAELPEPAGQPPAVLLGPAALEPADQQADAVIAHPGGLLPTLPPRSAATAAGEPAETASAARAKYSAASASARDARA